MFSIILYEPEIPPNTGNIIRLCANIGAQLHLIEPLGFVLEDKQLQRAGLDYHDLTCVFVHQSLEICLNALQPARVFALSTRGETLYTQVPFVARDAFLFGPETRGLPDHVRNAFPMVKIPQVPGARSLNLSNAVSVVVYEAWRQNNFTLA
jgi:tRNA (cytidine/uridine-2'-O-)-methyltransferase